MPSEKPEFALSIRQPWAWLVANSEKDIENRDWPTNFRGPFLVHASQSRNREEFDSAVEFVREFNPELADRIPSFDAIERGGIVGQAEVIDCVPDSDSPWFCGDFGFVVGNAVSCPLIPCKGALKFFRPSL